MATETRRGSADPIGTPMGWKPEICENVMDLDEGTLRWAAQLGVESLAFPMMLFLDIEEANELTEPVCRGVSERLERHGLKVGIVMLQNITKRIILGRPGRDEDIERVIRSIRAAAAAGWSALEYNFYNHRAVEGYAWDSPGRGGSTYISYDDARMHDLPPDPEVGTPTAEETWARFTYLLEAIMPVADEVGIRMAVHPNDPPPPTSRGAAQVLHHLDGMKKLVELVPNRAHGITLCQGSMSEWGIDVPEAIRYFGGRGKIHHVHYRNPRGTFPRYVETWLDEGDLDMVACMKAYRDVDYRHTLCSDHVPQLTDDVGFARIGRAYNHGYIKAMIQAANQLA